MTALSEAGDHTKIARLGKEFSDLSKAMELYSTREAAAKSMQELMAMQSESDTYTLVLFASALCSASYRCVWGHINSG